MMHEARRLRLDGQLCFALYAATNAIVRSYRPMLSEIGLTYPQYLLMLVLWQDGEKTVRQLADRLQLSPSAVTPLVDRLETSGLVRRRRDEADRRMVHVELTERGARTEKEAAAVQHRVACNTGLSPDELARMRDQLHLLAERLAEDAEACEPKPAG